MTKLGYELPRIIADLYIENLADEFAAAPETTWTGAQVAQHLRNRINRRSTT